MTIAIVTCWAFYGFCIHTFAGQTRVARPVVNASLPPLARTTLEVVWHGFTILFACIVIAIATRRLYENDALFDAATLQVFSVAVLFLVLGPKRAGSGFAAPQWMLLGPLFVCMLAMRLELPYAAPTLLGLIALVHVAWAFGLSWPSPSRASAAAYIVGLPDGARMPSHLACLTVAAVVTALATALAFEVPWARWLCVSVFAARFIYGMFERSLRPSIAGTPYALLSRVFYSPLCLLIAGLALAHA